MTWDPKYRRLDHGETILDTDEVQHDDGSWHSPHPQTVGTQAPDPCYTSHRQYRRLKEVLRVRYRIDDRPGMGGIWRDLKALPADGEVNQHVADSYFDKLRAENPGVELRMVEVEERIVRVAEKLKGGG